MKPAGIRVKWLSMLRAEKGAALVTVLLLVSVMAAWAAVTFDVLGYSIKRSTARKMFDQARYYAMGGEQLAVAAAEKLHKASARLNEPQAVSYPITGGRIDGVIRDASNCFNVNYLVVRREGGSYGMNRVAVLHYSRLLVLLGLAEAEAQQLTAALVDWLDTDSRPVPRGAEDYEYAALDTPYRTANSLMNHISELSMVRGYGPDVLALIAPYVCVGNDTAAARLNVNTLTVEQAPLLAALVGGDFTVTKAVDLIASRTARGYEDLADFWHEAAFAGRTIEQDVRRQTSIKSTLYESRVQVRYHEAVSYLRSVVYVNNESKGKILRHHFGVVQ